MGLLSRVWKSLTPTKALENTSGQFEVIFFEFAYRLIYLAGLSAVDNGIFYTLYSGAVKLMITVFVMSELLSLLDATSLDSVIDVFNVAVIQFISAYRYRMLTTHKDIYRKLATAMESPYFDISTARRQQIFTYWSRSNERYLKLWLGLGFCTLTVWYLYALFDDVDYNLVVAVKIPYNYQTPTLYGVTYVTVVALFNFTAFCVMVTNLIVHAHLAHFLCQFAVLGDCFENIIDDCSFGIKDLHLDYIHENTEFVEKYIERLRDLVKQHNFILSNTCELQMILSMPMLGQLAASSVLICFAGYQVTVAVRAGIAKFLMSLLYLGYNMFEIFMHCRRGDEIKVQSSRIGGAVYSSGWERMAMVVGARKSLLIITARAARPVVLSAGGLYDLSLSSYATLVKTSYSALTVLLRTQSE